MAASFTLSALVVNRTNPKPAKGIKTLSDITVRFGPKTVARLTVAGPHSQESALREFKLRGKTFKVEEGSEEIFAALVK